MAGSDKNKKSSKGGKGGGKRPHQSSTSPSPAPSTKTPTHSAARRVRRRPRASPSNTAALHVNNDLLWQRGYFGRHDRIREREWLAPRVGLGRHAVLKRENAAMDKMLGAAAGKTWRQQRNHAKGAQLWKRDAHIGALAAHRPAGYTPPVGDFRPEGTRLPSPAAPSRRRRAPRRRQQQQQPAASSPPRLANRRISVRTAWESQQQQLQQQQQQHDSPSPSPPPHNPRRPSAYPTIRLPRRIPAAPARDPDPVFTNDAFVRPTWRLPDPGWRMTPAFRPGVAPGSWDMEARMRVWTSGWYRDVVGGTDGDEEDGGEEEDGDDDDDDDDEDDDDDDDYDDFDENGEDDAEGSDWEE